MKAPSVTYVTEGILPDEVLDLFHPEYPSGCWIWVGAMRGEYPIVRVRPPGSTTRMIVQAHRFVYEVLVGKIPGRVRDAVTGETEPVELDHLCQTPRCVRPDHMEPVTKSENLRRRGRPIPADLPRVIPIDGGAA